VSATREGQGQDGARVDGDARTITWISFDDPGTGLREVTSSYADWERVVLHRDAGGTIIGVAYRR
jgi:hypothetical protein